MATDPEKIESAYPSDVLPDVFQAEVAAEQWIAEQELRSKIVQWRKLAQDVIAQRNALRSERDVLQTMLARTKESEKMLKAALDDASLQIATLKSPVRSDDDGGKDDEDAADTHGEADILAPTPILPPKKPGARVRQKSA